MKWSISPRRHAKCARSVHRLDPRLHWNGGVGHRNSSEGSRNSSDEADYSAWEDDETMQRLPTDGITQDTRSEMICLGDILHDHLESPHFDWVNWALERTRTSPFMLCGLEFAIGDDFTTFQNLRGTIDKLQYARFVVTTLLHRLLEKLPTYIDQRGMKEDLLRVRVVSTPANRYAVWRTKNGAIYPSQTKMWEGRTNISEHIFEALFKGVSTGFGTRTTAKSIDHPHFISCYHCGERKSRTFSPRSKWVGKT
jgi:hypothetical protein